MGEFGADPALVADPGELEALAERCEQATGPDRELNDLIYEASGNCLHAERAVKIVDGDPDDDEDFPAFYHTCKRCSRGASQRAAVPIFTASLDAAMTLVPEGWFPIIDAASEEGIALVDLWATVAESPANPLRRHAKGATPALALCAAALRARAASQDTPSPPEDM